MALVIGSVTGIGLAAAQALKAHNHLGDQAKADVLAMGGCHFRVSRLGRSEEIARVAADDAGSATGETLSHNGRRRVI